MATLLICGMAVLGLNGYGQHVHRQKVAMARREIKQALAEGDVIKPIDVKFNSKHDFVHRFAQVDDSLPKKDRVTPSLLIAQAGLESNWGDSVLYKKANNPFGVKGDYDGNYMSYYTGEDTKNGKSHIIMADFRQYPSLMDAIRDHNRLLKKKFLKGSRDNDYVSEAKALQANHYATDPNYAEKLMIYVQKNHLTKFD